MRVHPSLITVVSSVLLVSLAAVASAQSDTAAATPQMPKRWGVGLSYYWQNQPYGLESLTLGLPGFDPAAAAGLDVDNTTTTVHATFDYWLAPFLDVEILVGNIESDTDVKLSGVNIGIPLADLKVKTKGTVYGGGLTFVYGKDNVFGTLTGQYTATSMDREGSSVSAWVLTPKVGYRLGEKAAAYVGAMYQRPEEKHTGSYPVPPLGEVPYSVRLTSTDRWGYLAGVNVGITQNWLVTLEGGFGNRTSLLAHLDYRW